MKYTIMRRPMWQGMALTGLVWFGTWVLLFGVLLGYEWDLVVAGGLVYAVIGVPIMTLAGKALNPVAGPPLTADERIQVVRAVDRGQPPDNPRVQVAAEMLAWQRVRQRKLIVPLAVLYGICVVVAAAFAVVKSPRWWFLAALFVVSGSAFILRLHRQHKAATALLAAAENGTAGR